MATTSLWHIKGRLGDLIDYVENPEKTVPKGTEDFFNVFEYVRRPDKTTDQYVDAINCRKEIALQQMILTKKQYGKNDKYIAWHGYQSFKVGEVSPDVAHEIGMKLANEMWGDRFQVVITTHLDKDHIHNHFAFNSVSFRDGGKYNYSKKEQQRLRDTSDRLCREYELSVIAHPHKAPSRPVWMDEKSGKPTRYNVYRKDVTSVSRITTSPCTYTIEPPCTERYARWCERSAANHRLLLDFRVLFRHFSFFRIFLRNGKNQYNFLLLKNPRIPVQVPEHLFSTPLSRVPPIFHISHKITAVTRKIPVPN